MAHGVAVLCEDGEHRLIPIFVGLVALVDAFGFGKAGGVGEIILGKAIALGREELEEAPAAGPPPRLEPRQWRARDDVERQHLVGVAGGAVDRSEARRVGEGWVSTCSIRWSP